MVGRIALRIVRSPVGAVFRTIRENPLRAKAVGHSVHEGPAREIKAQPEILQRYLGM